MQQTLDDFGRSPGQQHTFLLRIWRTDATQPWRVTLRQVNSQEAQHFSSLAALISALWRQLQHDEQA